MPEPCPRCRDRGGWFVLDTPVHEPPVAVLRIGSRDCLLCFERGDVVTAVHQRCPVCRHAPAGEQVADVERWAAQVGFRWPEPERGRVEPPAIAGEI